MDLHSDHFARGILNLELGPDKPPHATLETFNDSVKQYKFIYEAQYSEQSKHILHTAVTKRNNENADVEPTAAQQLAIQNNVVSRDKIRRLLSFFVTSKF